jgi:hypothetical protein
MVVHLPVQFEMAGNVLRIHCSNLFVKRFVGMEFGIVVKSVMISTMMRVTDAQIVRLMMVGIVSQ